MAAHPSSESALRPAPKDAYSSALLLQLTHSDTAF